jgi:hypothetical protein
MIKNFIQILGLATLAMVARGQIVSGSTTLSGAVPSTQTFVCVASATNINTPSLAGGSAGSILLVNKEAMTVLSAGISSTCFNVQRASFASMYGGGAESHVNGEKVWVLQPVSTTSDPSRPITANEFLANRQYQPLIDAATPSISNPIATGAETDVAGKTWFTAIVVKHNSIATGACLLNGATTGTDKWILGVWDAHGNLLANTAVAGTTTGTASKNQCIAFVTPVALFDGQYFIGVQGNGTTDTFQAYLTGSIGTSWPTGVQTGTFGTLPNPLTITTTFTTAQGPIMYFY